MAQQKQDFQRQPRRKYCQFCKEETEYIDYKDVAIKRAREMALLPYTVPVVSSRGGRNRG